MSAVDSPIYDPELSSGDVVRVQYCDSDGVTRSVVVEVASDRLIGGEFIAVLARREVFGLIGHTDSPELAARRQHLPAGYDLGLVLIDECEPATCWLRVVVDNTKEI